MECENIDFLVDTANEHVVLKNEEIKEIVEKRYYSEVIDLVRGMTQAELQILYYWGFKLRNFIFCSAASQELREHYGLTPNYELCGERMSEYT
jgi:hypothetical protein